MRRMLVIGAVTVLGLGVGGTALAATNGNRPGAQVSVPAGQGGPATADDPPHHDAGDDNGVDGTATPTPSRSVDDHGQDPTDDHATDDHATDGHATDGHATDDHATDEDAPDDHGGARARTDDAADHDATDDHGGSGSGGSGSGGSGRR